jgi:hypothetical protein
MNRSLQCFVLLLVVAVHRLYATGEAFRPLDVAVSQGSIRINGIELRSGPRPGKMRYISLEAAKKALGQPQDTYLAGLGLTVYAWRDAGIHLQRGFRGVDKGKIFKMQIWFEDEYDKAESKHTGKFNGRVHVDGIDISPETTFETIRTGLQKAGYEIREDSNPKSAEKGEISIFTVNGSNKIERVEAWCSP